MPRSPLRRSPRHLLLALASALLLAVAGSAGASAVAPTSASAAPRELYDIYLTATKCTYGAMGHCRRVAVKAGAPSAQRVLNRCFNCVFPVAGAPRAYPRDRQFIPLKACVAGIFCKAAPVRFNEVAGAGWFGLDAQRGHFDGAGSKIWFRFYRQPSTGHLRLRVRAVVTNPSVPDFANRALAKEMWTRFAHNMGAAV